MPSKEERYGLRSRPINAGGGPCKRFKPTVSKLPAPQVTDEIIGRGGGEQGRFRD